MYLYFCGAGISLGDASRQFGEGYEEGWRPYVAANLHFYTTLHVLFLRALSRRDLSTNLTALLHILDNNLRVGFPRNMSANYHSPSFIMV